MTTGGWGGKPGYETAIDSVHAPFRTKTPQGWIEVLLENNFCFLPLSVVVSSFAGRVTSDNIGPGTAFSY
jgi:hypothetical protein